MNYYCINREEWEKRLESLLLSYNVFAQIAGEYSQDYEFVTPDSIQGIVYNKPKPVTPLKNFFLPVRENVTSERKDEKPRMIIGVPNCDVAALGLLDEIYLEAGSEDIFYRKRRENTLIISSDCFELQEYCHCVSYDVKPWSSAIADLGVVMKNDLVIFRVISPSGNKFVGDIGATPVTDKTLISFIDNRHRETEDLLSRSGKGLPGCKTTGDLINESDEEIWTRHSATCVSCGACTTICPTCTCFLLIDKPGFHKVKQMDACQYPGFERVAGGEDPLLEITHRFRNRYMCKYLWKSRKFKSSACTGCGRCIEACIGKINKNEIFMELAK